MIKIISQIEKRKRPYKGYDAETVHYVYDEFTLLETYRAQYTNLREVKKIVLSKYGDFVYSHVGTIRVDK